MQWYITAISTQSESFKVEYALQNAKHVLFNMAKHGRKKWMEALNLNLKFEKL